ncbi:hypothetical protein EUX98_g3094 [Antrodiella citrinella]|uniref:F-box domain-containing protein n=1 Tax=Antrodiella citrinella TaxID=2447956 RepID=A0A4S4MZK4_9APHY|nr:hypothetical protein EUX98_g3094 [Antrodiella citrinella]
MPTTTRIATMSSATTLQVLPKRPHVVAVLRNPNRSNPRLPPELIDTIIDYLHEDISTLRNFALVSRRWLKSTRYHLFHHVSVLASSDYARPFAPFMRFLETAPHIGQFIRELELCGYEERHHARSEFGTLDSMQLIPIIRRLPFLHTLILSQVFVVAPSATGSWSEFTMRLRKLVYNEIYSDCEGAQWLVTVFKVYDTLHILDPIPVPEKPSPAIMNMPADSFNLLEDLKSLVIESRNDPMSLGKIEGLMPFIMKKVTSLELLLELEEKEHIGRLEAFIRSKGTSLKHLRLDICDVEIFQKGPGVNLTAICPQLQSVHLCLSSNHTDIASDHWGYGTAVIAHGPRSVRRVTIGMALSDHDNDNEPFTVDLAGFESALMGLKDLEWVKFQVEGGREGWKTTAECAQPLEREWKDYLVQHLPKLRNRGLLRFLE